MSFLFPLLLKHLEQNEEFLEQHCQKNTTACMMPGHQTNMPESRQNNASSITQHWKATFIQWTWEEPGQWTGNRNFIFLLCLCHDSCSSCVLHKMPHSPCLAHKLLVLQATFGLSWLSINTYNTRHESWNTCVILPFPNVDLGITVI